MRKTHTIIIPFEHMIGDAESMLMPPATQFHFYCPVCGEVWLHAINQHPLQHHEFLPQRCRKHGGGLLYPYFRSCDLPRNLLIREFMLELEATPKQRPNGLPEPYDGTFPVAINRQEI